MRRHTVEVHLRLTEDDSKTLDQLFKDFGGHYSKSQIVGTALQTMRHGIMGALAELQAAENEANGEVSEVTSE